MNLELSHIIHSTLTCLNLDGGKAAGSVKLKDGTNLPADVVVLGVGVGPQTDYLKNSKSFQLEEDGSLKVDQHFKVEGFDNIYATGKKLAF